MAILIAGIAINRNLLLQEEPMETLITTLIISLTLCALGRYYYNSLSENNGDGCGCGGSCGGSCGNSGDQHDLKPATTTDTAKKNKKTPTVKPTRIPVN